MPKANVYILGIVHHFFHKEDFSGDGDFIWKTVNKSNKKIVYVGCKFSIWGNIAGEVCRYFAKNEADTIIYIGKLGSLKADHIPNKYLATGSVSNVLNKEIH